MNNEALLIQIDQLSDLADKRFSYQEDVKRLRKLAPQSTQAIDEALRNSRDLAQPILDKAIFVGKSRPMEHLVNRKKWAVLRKVLELEEKQANGLIVSPTLALLILFGNGKPYAMEPPKKKHEWERETPQPTISQNTKKHTA